MNYLPEFEETMINIAAYLLVAHEKHAKYILGKPEDQLLEMRSTMRLRVTQHYTAALLTYGFTMDTQELQWAAEWFATPFPKHHLDVIDMIEMIKLEGLLNLRNDDPTITPRLQQLVRQRNDYYFEIDRADEHDTPTPIFDTLWALKVLMMARRHGLLEGLITDDVLKVSLNHVMDVAVYDKDIALALHLCYDLFGTLESKHEAVLAQLLKRSEPYSGLWGIQRQDMWERVQDIVDAMKHRHLTPAILDNQVDTFREIILNLCYVVENLAPLAAHYPEVQAALHESLALWWRQFQGDNAPANIRTLFSKDYDYLMVMCRTLVAVGAYVGEPLSALCWLPSLRKMSQSYNTNTWEESENIKRALREWIEVDLGEPVMLKLGLSEANVVRITPTISNPTDDAKNDLLRSSLIVKYGPAEEIERERQNYGTLPARMLNAFVNIPAASYIDEQRQRAFVIMQDLNNYHTLFEVYDVLLRSDSRPLTNQLSEFLLNVHRGDHTPPIYCANTRIRELYILPMLQHLDYLTIHLQNRDVYTEQHVQRFSQIEQQLNGLIAGIMQNLHHAPPFPQAFMHGDLHSRNIMIRTHPKSGKNHHDVYEFKLIDLESLRHDGDVAHDAGQLLVDLNLLQISGKKNLNRNIYARIADLQKDLLQTYNDFAAERADETFMLRLGMANARALVRIAKGRAKRSNRHMDRREYQQAQVAATDILNLTEEAVIHLQEVYEQLCP